jgi:hypothetical protein
MPKTTTEKAATAKKANAGRNTANALTLDSPAEQNADAKTAPITHTSTTPTPYSPTNSTTLKTLTTHSWQPETTSMIY